MIETEDQQDASRERGATLVEYALLIALIAIACVVAVQFFAGGTKGALNTSGSSIFGVGS
jgi:pilus assembly protein Flp/PilA